MNTNVKEASQCPSCEKLMPAGALAGLCPACLLAQGADTESGDSAGSGRFQPPPLEEITRLFPQLEILRLLGAGGMGAVYKARQRSLDRFVALKVLPGKGVSGANFEERFNREARALARLTHPNIVAVFEFGQVGGEGGLHFFVMEFVDGANLRQLEQAGRLAPRQALQIIPQICDALQYAHDEGVVHRDIKPENVLVDRKGRVKIADFGLAKILGVEPNASRLTAEGQVMGTPHYMAPEQIEKPLTVDHRADIYSLGVVLYEMLTGDLPLGKFAPPSRKYHLDVRLDEVVLRALENDPARRYQQASEVKSQVETIAGTSTPALSGEPQTKEPGRQAGFSLVNERNGRRVVQWKGAFVLGGIVFGFLTMAFGSVFVVTGRPLMRWLGMVDGWSDVIRLVLSIAVVAWMARLALRRKEPESPTCPPEGNGVLPAKKFSRQAILGVAFLPFAALVPLAMMISPVIAGPSSPGSDAWRGTLAAVCVLMGFTAVFASMSFGTTATWDIRRSNGRLSGLPLALLAQLFFPLLFLDVAICSASLNGFGLFSRPLGGEIVRLFRSPTLDVLGALAICLPVNFFIVRRQWRLGRSVVEADQPEEKWTWSSAQIGTVISIVCGMILYLVAAHRSQPEAIRSPEEQGAKQVAGLSPETHTAFEELAPVGGPFLARVEDGTVELVAVRAYPYDGGSWWSPDGGPSSIPSSVQANVSPNSGSVAQGIEFLLEFNGTNVSFLDPTLYGAKGEARYSVSRRLLPPPDATETTFTIWLAGGLWRTAASQKTDLFGWFDSDPGRDCWKWSSNPDGSILLELDPWPAKPPYTAQQFVAVDVDGLEHMSWRSEEKRISTETVSRIAVTFGGAASPVVLERGLTLNRVKEFRFQIRQGSPVVFKQISLRPGHRTQVAVVSPAK